MQRIKKIRCSLIIFIVGLIISGLTAFPLLWELNILASSLGIPPNTSWTELNGLQRWVAYVQTGLKDTYSKYPFIGYGTDWLAFAHLIIAVFFIGPLIDPVKNRWIVISGLIACVGVFPLALICGEIRSIPLYWRMIDCSFGLFGGVPLLYILRQIRKLEAENN